VVFYALKHFVNSMSYRAVSLRQLNFT